MDLFKEFIVRDYDGFKSLILSKITLPEDDVETVKKIVLSSI